MNRFLSFLMQVQNNNIVFKNSTRTHTNAFTFKNMKLCSVLLFALTLSFSALSQSSNGFDFHPPLKIPLVLSSNFGELRPNHFHMGLDFKTNNKIGYRLYAIEEGYVSRIKVSTYGYGKVVYIDHPNGITSVYAHCSEFKGAIDSLVKATQIAEQNFEVEIFPGENVIPVSRGQVIALSGNTGGSTAPHLHFEIRDTETEHALNPLLFGFPMEDHRAPEIRRMKVYGLTENGYRLSGKALEKTVSKSGTKYVVSGNTISIGSNYFSDAGIGFAFDVIDRFDGAGNQCGLFGSILIIDGDTIFGQATERVPFESTRFVNSHKDYEAYQANRRKYHKCFRTIENDLPIYENETLGIFKSEAGKSHQVKYIAYDAAGNESVLTFTLKILKTTVDSSNPDRESLPQIHPQKPFLFETETCAIEAGYATVYEPMLIKEGNLCSHIGDSEAPVNRAYKIKLKVEGSQDGKHYLRMKTAKGRTRAIPIEYEDGWAVASCKYFGSYELVRDVTEPSVSLISYSTTIPASASRVSWSISDTGSGIEDYDLFIDDTWHLLEYDYKTGRVTFDKPSGFKGKKLVKVIVKDACGNKKTFERTLNFL